MASLLGPQPIAVPALRPRRSAWLLFAELSIGAFGSIALSELRPASSCRPPTVFRVRFVSPTSGSGPSWRAAVSGLAGCTIAKIRRAYFVQGKSIKAICRELRVSRKVVRKVLRTGATEFSYERAVQPLPRIGPWKADLDRILSGNEAKPARERLTLIRIFEELSGLGYAGGYDAVRRYARSWQRERSASTADAYVPLSFAPGEAYQFDWSHEVVLINGTTVIVKVAHVRLCHSRMPATLAIRHRPGGSAGRALDDPTLGEIAKKHGKSAAQIIVPWHLHEGLIAIPKSTHRDRIHQNLDVFDFELDAADLQKVRGLDTPSSGRIGSDPAKAAFLF
jgi:hypothetical protein